MRMMNKIIASIAVLLMIAVPFVSVDLASEAVTKEDFSILIDTGEGTTYWISPNNTKTTFDEVLETALQSIGMSYSSQGKSITVDEKKSTQIGTISSSWKYYIWEDNKWKDNTNQFDGSSTYSGGFISIGFYPNGIVPTETPKYNSSWTMVRGNSSQDGSQTTDRTGLNAAEIVFDRTYGRGNYITGSILVSENKALVVVGGTPSIDPVLYCYDRFTWELLWEFSYELGAGYETATGVIIGGHFYLPATNGTVYKLSLEDGTEVESLTISKVMDHDLVGSRYFTGPSSLTYNSGVIYFGTNNGFIYCVSLDLDVLWKTPVGGSVYFMATTVVDDLLYTGALNGHLYIINAKTGRILEDEHIYSVEKTESAGINKYGLVAVPIVIDNTIFMSISDGQGMGTTKGGIAIYEYDGQNLKEMIKDTSVGPASNYLLPVINDEFTGVYFTSARMPLGRVSTDGTIEELNDSFEQIKAPMVLVNDKSIIISEYNAGGYLYEVDLEGNIIGKIQQPEDVQEWAMSAPTIIGDMIYIGTDGGFYVVQGDLTVTPIVVPEENNIILWIVLLALLLLLIGWFVYMSKVKHVPPIKYLRERVNYLTKTREGESKTKHNKRRLLIVLILGSIAAFIMFIFCLSFGPSGSLSISETLSSLISAISKGGENLTFNELIVYESRLPRAIAAFGVGIGLAVAGCLYQAVIRNPLVDPYIMGVSSGAGLAAVAVIAYNFTLFGLLDGSSFLIPIVAIVGGLAAFFLTALIAEKAGASSTNYVLAGVVVGLALSSIMTIMLVTSPSDKLHGAISWLYGSFANISWDTVFMVFFPALFLSLVPLLWAKELNLVLLGEDQAQQMGLNVKRFNRSILILASVLTSICVAFVGIIGFVGLVIPHLCRMILGGDHRLVLPASIVLGGALMLFADLVARMIMLPQELPVGAITTIIGVPLFAYLLIKKGRMYDGQ